MTAEDKERLWRYVILIGIYHPVTADSAVNFIFGYEEGAKGSCTFTTQLSELLTAKYKLTYSGDGWPGQIKRLAKKRSSTWVIVFRILTLELIVQEQGGNLTEGQQTTLKARITSVMKRLEASPSPPFDSFWVADWLALCGGKSTWFKQLWTKKEWVGITTFTKLMQAQGPAIGMDE